MSERVSLILDEIRYNLQKAIDINKEEVDLLDMLSRTDDQGERESLVYRIDTINADMFDFLDKVDSYVVDLDETLGGDSDED